MAEIDSAIIDPVNTAFVLNVARLNTSWIKLFRKFESMSTNSYKMVLKSELSKLASQSINLHIYQPGISEIVVTPDLFQQILAGCHIGTNSDQFEQDKEFCIGKFQLLAINS